MSFGRAFAFGIGVGVVAGAGGALAFGAASPRVEHVMVERPAEQAAAAPEGVAPQATLAGTAAPATAPAATVVLLDLAACARDDVPNHNLQNVWSGQLWKSLAGALVHARREDEALRVLEAAIAAGIPPEGANEILGWAPEDVRTRLMRALHAKHPKVAWHPTYVAALQAADGLGDAAFSTFLTLLKQGALSVPDGVRRLAAIDAARADGALRGLEAERRWTSQQLGEVAAGLRAAGAADLAGAWQERATARAGDERTAYVATTRGAPTSKPDDPDAWRNLASLQEEEGNRGAAWDSWRKVVALDPFDEDAYGALARLDPAAALPLVEAAAEKSVSPTLLDLLAKTRLVEGHGAEALAVVLRLPDDQAGPWWDTPVAAFDATKALAYLDERLKSPRYRHEGRYLRARADALLAAGRGAEAFDAAKAAFEAASDDRSILTAMIEADPARAAAVFEERLKESPTDSWIGVLRGEALAVAGRKEEARRVLDPLRDRGHEEWNVAMAAAGSTEALAALEQLTKENGEASGPWENLSDALRFLGRPADARAAMDRALSASEDDLRLRVKRLLMR